MLFSVEYKVPGTGREYGCIYLQKGINYCVLVFLHLMMFLLVCILVCIYFADTTLVANTCMMSHLKEEIHGVYNVANNNHV